MECNDHRVTSFTRSMSTCRMHNHTGQRKVRGTSHAIQSCSLCDAHGSAPKPRSLSTSGHISLLIHKGAFIRSSDPLTTTAGERQQRAISSPAPIEYYYSVEIKLISGDTKCTTNQVLLLNIPLFSVCWLVFLGGGGGGDRDRIKNKQKNAVRQTEQP